MPPLRDHFGSGALTICRRLQKAGHDAVIVGGPVRDVLLGCEPSDVDLATSARPEEVRALFDRTFTVGKGERHGTVGVFAGPEVTESLEVTTYRLDVVTDGRHAEVTFTDELEDDLARRDFTVNAMAVRPDVAGGGELVDPFDGQDDLEAGVLRTVGPPEERFAEDYLRVLRGYRFAARFGFTIEEATREAMRAAVGGLKTVSRERVREELMKMLAQTPAGEGRLTRGFVRMQSDGVIAELLPELEACVGVTQNEYHAHDVFGHLVRAADAASPERPLLRFAMLVHDIGKPDTRSVGEDGRVHFYDHEHVGAELAAHLTRRLAFSGDERDWVVEAVRQHMRFLQMRRGMTARQLRRIGRDLERLALEDLLAIRVADKAASGIDAYELDEEEIAPVRATIAQIREEEQAMKVTDLAIDGRDVMEILDLEPGPAVGAALEALLEHVIEHPGDNTREALLARLRRQAPSRGVVR